jgi:uncharacterized protein
VILYCDTSALIKRYVEEDGTEYVDALWEDCWGVATSTVAFAEAMSVFSRKLREGLLSKKEYTKTIKKFKDDYEHLILVTVDNNLNSVIMKLFNRHPLRGFDAIHLASALVFTNLKETGLLFACFDRILNEAAIKERLKVIHN